MSATPYQAGDRRSGGVTSMKKRLAATLILLLTWSSMNVTTATAATPLRTACRFQHLDGHDGWNVTEVKRTIRCAVKRWPVPGGLDYAMYIADRESNFTQYATSSTNCKGVYQWATSTWAAVLDDFPRLYAVLKHDVYNARSNVMYAIRYANLRDWGPWGG